MNVLFERPALERFVQLVNELLAVLIPDDSKADMPMIHAPADDRRGHAQAPAT